MVRKKGSFILCGVFLFIVWNALLLLFLWGRPPTGRLGDGAEPGEDWGVAGGRDLAKELIRLVEEVESELATQKKLLQQLQSHRSLWERLGKRVMDRRNGGKDLPQPPQIYPALANIDQNIQVQPAHRKFQGYYKISRHYRWALNQVFNTLSHSTVVIVEDDLEVAPDFFEYFRSLYPILRSDPTLWCVSAWNDNGREGLVDPGKADLLYRTDFFPGLGWMLLKELWTELEPKWPATFWDDWMRQPDQRRERSCIRPEISRTLTFGRKGVSLGQFFDQYLRYIKLNTEFVPFTKRDLSYLVRVKYNEMFEKEVYSAPSVKAEDLKGGTLQGTGPFRVQYSSKENFKILARNLGVMDDLKSGVPRAGYRGVVSFMSRGRRIYLAPPSGWSHYDTSWS
ncbi:hypothetical protein AAFF_G00249910 [Aldrovandia affinis]|uniref:Alpha-1,3-mannosyl-glycoprotein 2-beta-N-acetylglucosaminyltransferase n=1 Tax=Aldrovandia affinis TaxID=143900 RepID=A0AAD7RDH5_9TELE|nr:hypothetical protein AAFF_G00249910 [Aldrovandia affinis]